MAKPKQKIEWYVEFWDFTDWDVCEGPFQHKPQAITKCQELNRKIVGKSYPGHRCRVRGRIINEV